MTLGRLRKLAAASRPAETPEDDARPPQAAFGDGPTRVAGTAHRGRGALTRLIAKKLAVSPFINGPEDLAHLVGQRRRPYGHIIEVQNPVQLLAILLDPIDDKNDSHIDGRDVLIEVTFVDAEGRRWSRTTENHEPQRVIEK